MARYDGREDERQSNEDGQGCTDIVNEWKSFNTSGDKAVPGVGDDVDEKETNNSITSLNKLNNKLVSYLQLVLVLLLLHVYSPNLETDLGSCAKESSRQDVTITLTIVKIRSDITLRIVFFLSLFRFYVFWCGWFQITVVEVKIITLEISFGPSPSPSPSPVILPPDCLLIHSMCL